MVCRKGDPRIRRHGDENCGTSKTSNGRYSLAGFTAAVGEALIRVGRRHLGGESELLCTGQTTEIRVDFAAPPD